jgi:protein required for attachment to host cells
MLYVLIADNKSARVCQFDVQENTLEELAAFRNVELGRHERDLLSDRPGRVLNGASGIHHSYEPHESARQRLAQRWLKSVGMSLRSLLAGRANDGLILVAAARTLAELRASLPATLRVKVRVEIQRNLVKHSQRDLLKRLRPALRVGNRTLPSHRPTARRSERPAAA